MTQTRVDIDGFFALLLFDGNAALANANFDTSRLLTLLVEHIAKYTCGNREHAYDSEESVTIHGLV